MQYDYEIEEKQEMKYVKQLLEVLGSRVDNIWIHIPKEIIHSNVTGDIRKYLSFSYKHTPYTYYFNSGTPIVKLRKFIEELAELGDIPKEKVIDEKIYKMIMK